MIRVLLEDNHCLAIDKPAGLLSQGDATGDPSAVDWARDYLKRKYAKPGNVYVGLVHRLDRPTSGVLLIARTSKAAERLADQFRSGTVRKTYLAIVEGTCPEDRGEWSDHLIKDERTNTVRVVGADSAGGKPACVRFEVIRRASGHSAIELSPTTGRGHQLRVQLASRGLPIVGDLRYGAKSALDAADGHRRIALHAAALVFMHPIAKVPTTIAAPIPADWPIGTVGRR